MSESIITDQIQIVIFPNDFEINPTTLTADLINEKIIGKDNIAVNSFLPKEAPGDIVRIEAAYIDNKDIQ